MNFFPVGPVQIETCRQMQALRPLSPRGTWRIALSNSRWTGSSKFAGRAECRGNRKRVAAFAGSQAQDARLDRREQKRVLDCEVVLRVCRRWTEAAELELPTLLQSGRE